MKETLGVGKEIMLTHAYPHKPMRKIKVATYNHQADADAACGMVSAVVI